MPWGQQKTRVSILHPRCPEPRVVSLHLTFLIECSAIAEHHMREWGKIAPFSTELTEGKVNGRRQEQREHLPSVTQLAGS